MDALPALTTIANAAVRRQFRPDAASRTVEPRPARPARARLALAAALERAAHAVTPAECRPAH